MKMVRRAVALGGLLFAGSLLAEEIDVTRAVGKKPIDILLFNALPGSGKSETRKYLNSFPVKERRAKFGIGEMVEIDDFPYVFFMRCASEEFVKL